MCAPCSSARGGAGGHVASSLSGSRGARQTGNAPKAPSWTRERQGNREIPRSRHTVAPNIPPAPSGVGEPAPIGWQRIARAPARAGTCVRARLAGRAASPTRPGASRTRTATPPPGRLRLLAPLQIRHGCWPRAGMPPGRAGWSRPAALAAGASPAGRTLGSSGAAGGLSFQVPLCAA